MRIRANFTRTGANFMGGNREFSYELTFDDKNEIKRKLIHKDYENGFIYFTTTNHILNNFFIKVPRSSGHDGMRSPACEFGNYKAEKKIEKYLGDRLNKPVNTRYLKKELITMINNL